jgi:hypothetical protein
MNKPIVFILSLFLFSFSYSQDTIKEKKCTLNGYVTDMQSVMIFDSLDGNWIQDNLIHNRLNLKWFPLKCLNFEVSARTRLFAGESVKYTPAYAIQTAKDKGLIDLNITIIDGNSYVLNTQIDRAVVEFDQGNWTISLGRQRINWGRSFVWNPNDLFNSYSFFDFDYPEKPGSDALRIQYYTSETSSAELVAKTDSSKKLTVAGLYKFAAGGYDFQFLGGMINEQDYIIGAGWEGNIKSLSFKGEASYLRPKENFRDTSGVFLICTHFNYLFENSLFLQFEFLYNKQMQTGNFASYYYQPLTVKNLSFTEYNLFAGVSYPFSPLFSGTLSAIYYPEIKGFYIGPSFSYSLTESLDFNLIFQTFRVKEFMNPFTGAADLRISFAFLQFKYNF